MCFPGQQQWVISRGHLDRLPLGGKADWSLNSGHLHVVQGIFRPSRIQLSELQPLQGYTPSSPQHNHHQSLHSILVKSVTWHLFPDITTTKRWLLISQYQIGKAHGSSVGCFKNTQVPGSTKTGRRRRRDSSHRCRPRTDHRVSAYLFPCNNHGMFSCYSTDKNFLSLLALTHVFLVFIWKHAFSCCWPPIPRAQQNVRRLSKKCAAIPWDSISSQYISKGPQMTDLPEDTHSHTKYISFSEPKAYFPQSYDLSSRWDHMAWSLLSAPSQLTSHSWVDSRLLGGGHS